MARNAFRVGLRDTPLPVATAAATQELDPGDILEVQDMAEAIARAEQMVAAPRSSPAAAMARDIFDSLVDRSAPRATTASRSEQAASPYATGRATDDTAGPATPAPSYAALGALIGAPPRSEFSSSATPFTPPPPRYVTMPVPPSSGALSPDDDAYYHPAGRIRSLADATLEGYRPEPTLLVRAASRRKRFSGLLLAALLPLVVLAGFAISSSIDVAGPANAPATVTLKASPAAPVRGKTALATTSAGSKVAVASPETALTSSPAAPSSPRGTPVFDVNSLPSAHDLRSKR